MIRRAVPLLAIVVVVLVVVTTLVVLRRASAGATPPAPPAVAPLRLTPAEVSVPDTDFDWWLGPAPRGASVTIGVVHAAGPGPRRVVLMIPGSDGLDTAYLPLARTLASRGFDVAVGCWFVNGAAPTVIPCTNGPTFTGVSAAALRDLDAVITLTRRVLDVQPNETVGLWGFSRGGGLVALHATTGSRDPVFEVAGMLTGTNGLAGRVPNAVLPGELSVVARERHGCPIEAPIFVVQGLTDGAAQPEQAVTFVEALHRCGQSPEVHLYPDQGHGLLAPDLEGTDVMERAAAFFARTLPPSGP